MNKSKYTKEVSEESIPKDSVLKKKKLLILSASLFKSTFITDNAWFRNQNNIKAQSFMILHNMPWWKVGALQYLKSTDGLNFSITPITISLSYDTWVIHGYYGLPFFSPPAFVCCLHGLINIRHLYFIGITIRLSLLPWGKHTRFEAIVLYNFHTNLWLMGCQSYKMF